MNTARAFAVVTIRVQHRVGKRTDEIGKASPWTVKEHGLAGVVHLAIQAEFVEVGAGREWPLPSPSRLVFLPILAAFAVVPHAFALTIRVPGDAATIQIGLDPATSGDTVLVAPGTFPNQGMGTLAVSDVTYSSVIG